MDNQEIQAKLCTQDTGRKKKQLSAENFKEEHSEHHQKSRVNPGAREGYAVKSICVAEADTGFINSTNSTNSDILSYFDFIERHTDRLNYPYSIQFSDIQIFLNASCYMHVCTI
jgi:hypothetical protein